MSLNLETQPRHPTKSHLRRPFLNLPPPPRPPHPPKKKVRMSTSTPTIFKILFDSQHPPYEKKKLESLRKSMIESFGIIADGEKSINIVAPLSESSLS